MWKPTKKEKKSINLKAKLDKIFSEFIRLRDSNHEGYVQCVSCGNVHYWREVDCGHYINRKHMNTRYNEKNCNGQCRSCNRFDEGNASGYTLGLISKYGKDIIDILIMAKNLTQKHSYSELEILIDYYKKEVKELKSKKSLR